MGRGAGGGGGEGAEGAGGRPREGAGPRRTRQVASRPVTLS